MYNADAKWYKETPGRKPQYAKEHLLDTVIAYISGGYNQTQIANSMGVHPNTFSKWKKRYPEIEEAIAHGKELLIGRAENALVKRALGYKTTVEKHIVTLYGCENPDKKPRRVEKIITVEREIAPDLAAVKTLLSYLGKKLEKSNKEEVEDRISWFLEGLREPDEVSEDNDSAETEDGPEPESVEIPPDSHEARETAAVTPNAPEQDKNHENPRENYPFYP
ncbi:MAG: hypothetical protein A2Y33_12615 [Spirochaetes bacterium GWF1_51_8]|nr:MAG: hypothetical protein A2Y33_12615 [Spirochaetes bacterium GWF1_51_8]